MLSLSNCLVDLSIYYGIQVIPHIPYLINRGIMYVNQALQRRAGGSMEIVRFPIVNRSISLFDVELPLDIVKEMSSYMKTLDLLNLLSTNSVLRESYLAPLRWNLRCITKADLFLLEECNKNDGSAILNLEETFLDNRGVFEILKVFLRNPVAKCIKGIKIGEINEKNKDNVCKLLEFIDSEELLSSFDSFYVKCLKTHLNLESKKLRFLSGKVIEGGNELECGGCEQLTSLCIGECLGNLNINRNKSIKELFVNHLTCPDNLKYVFISFKLEVIKINKFSCTSSGKHDDRGRFNLIIKDCEDLRVLHLGNDESEDVDLELCAWSCLSLKELHIGALVSLTAFFFLSDYSCKLKVLERFTYCSAIKDQHPATIAAIEKLIIKRRIEVSKNNNIDFDKKSFIQDSNDCDSL